MEAPGIPRQNLQEQTQATVGLDATTTGARGTESVSLWETLKRTCGAGPAVDSFDACSFDEDAKTLTTTTLTPLRGRWETDASRKQAVDE